MEVIVLVLHLEAAFTFLEKRVSFFEIHGSKEITDVTAGDCVIYFEVSVEEIDDIRSVLRVGHQA